MPKYYSIKTKWNAGDILLCEFLARCLTTLTAFAPTENRQITYFSSFHPLEPLKSFATNMKSTWNVPLDSIAVITHLIASLSRPFCNSSDSIQKVLKISQQGDYGFFLASSPPFHLVWRLNSIGAIIYRILLLARTRAPLFKIIELKAE